MTDEFGFSGLYRFSVPLKRGVEKKTIEICADTERDAERLALVVGSDSDYVDWNEDDDSDVELDGLVECLQHDPDVELSRRFNYTC